MALVESHLQVLVARALELVEQTQDSPLNPLQLKVLEGVLLGLRYKEIYKALSDAEQRSGNVTLNSLQRSTAYQLWNQLTEALQKSGFLNSGEKVGKSNVQEMLERTLSSYRDCPPGDYISDGFGDRIAWVGRQSLLEELAERLNQDCRIVSIVGISGIGKTSMAARLTKMAEIGQRFAAIKFIRFDEATNSDFAQVAQEMGESADQLRQENSLNQALQKVLQLLKEQPHLLILDMAEAALTVDVRGQFQFRDIWLQQMIEAVVKPDTMASAVIFTSQLKLPEILEGRYSLRIHEHQLRGLESEEVEQLFQVWGIPVGLEHRAVIQQYWNVYEGHPLALKVIVGEIRSEPYNGSFTAYWQDYGPELDQFQQWMTDDCNEGNYPRLDSYSCDLTDLVRSRLNRSLEQLATTAPIAHQLLCMGAIHRRAVGRDAWLTLLQPDFSHSQLIDAFQTLQRRFLLEPEQVAPEKVLYRLHNLVRCTTLDRLGRLI
jgi:hypothetical protein